MHAHVEGGAAGLFDRSVFIEKRECAKGVTCSQIAPLRMPRFTEGSVAFSGLPGSSQRMHRSA